MILDELINPLDLSLTFALSVVAGLGGVSAGWRSQVRLSWHVRVCSIKRPPTTMYPTLQTQPQTYMYANFCTETDKNHESRM